MEFFKFGEVVDELKLDPAVTLGRILQVRIFVVICLAEVIFNLELDSLLHCFLRKDFKKVLIKNCVLFSVLVELIVVKNHLIKDGPFRQFCDVDVKYVLATRAVHSAHLVFENLKIEQSLSNKVRSEVHRRHHQNLVIWMLQVHISYDTCQNSGFTCAWRTLYQSHALSAGTSDCGLLAVVVFGHSMARVFHAKIAFTVFGLLSNALPDAFLDQPSIRSLIVFTDKLLLLNRLDLAVNVLPIVSDSEIELVTVNMFLVWDLLALVFIKRVQDIDLEPDREVWPTSTDLNSFDNPCANVVFSCGEVGNDDRKNDMLSDLLLDCFGNLESQATINFKLFLEFVVDVLFCYHLSV